MSQILARSQAQEEVEEEKANRPQIASTVKFCRNVISKARNQAEIITIHMVYSHFIVTGGQALGSTFPARVQARMPRKECLSFLQGKPETQRDREPAKAAGDEGPWSLPVRPRPAPLKDQQDRCLQATLLSELDCLAPHP